MQEVTICWLVHIAGRQDGVIEVWRTSPDSWVFLRSTDPRNHRGEGETLALVKSRALLVLFISLYIHLLWLVQEGQIYPAFYPMSHLLGARITA